MKKIFIFGASQYAQIIHSYLKEDFQIHNFIVDDINSNPKELFDVKVISTADFLDNFSTNDTKLIIGIAQSNLNFTRKNKYIFFKNKGYKFLSYIHKSVKIFDSNTIGENTFIFDGCSIAPFSEIGNNCIIWQNSVIGHHVKIHDHCFMAGPSTVCGNSTLLENVYLGVSATVRDGITIEQNSYIGAGCLIMHNVAKNSLYAINNAKKSPMNSIDFFKIKENI